jgi:hypothetical protein
MVEMTERTGSSVATSTVSVTRASALPLVPSIFMPRKRLRIALLHWIFLVVYSSAPHRANQSDTILTELELAEQLFRTQAEPVKCKGKQAAQKG